jgi:hypothetical protein
MKTYSVPKTLTVNLVANSVLQSASPETLPITPPYPGAPARQSYTPQPEPGK